MNGAFRTFSISIFFLAAMFVMVAPATAQPVSSGVTNFPVIVDWAYKTGKPRTIPGIYAKQMGLSDTDRDIDAVQKAYSNSQLTLSMLVPKNDQMDVLVDYKDDTKEVCWKVNRAGFVDQTYKSPPDGNFTHADNLYYSHDFKDNIFIFEAKMNRSMATNQPASQAPK
jgi:hypothetical protein